MDWLPGRWDKVWTPSMEDVAVAYHCMCVCGGVCECVCWLIRTLCPGRTAQQQSQGFASVFVFQTLTLLTLLLYTLFFSTQTRFGVLRSEIVWKGSEPACGVFSLQRHLRSVSPFTLLICVAAIKDTRTVRLRLRWAWPCLQHADTLSYFSFCVKVVWFQTGCYRPASGITKGRGDSCLCALLCVCVCVCVCHCIFAGSETDLLEKARRVAACCWSCVIL